MATEKLSREDRAARAAAKVTAAQEVLEAEVAAIQSGEDWKRFLELQAKLHAYSPSNVALIYAQHTAAYADGKVNTPEPGYVAGFATWRALGRNVNKGQHGYAVLAPLRRVERIAVDSDGRARPLANGETAEAGETEQARPKIRGFKVEYVFCEAQTSGDPLPTPPRPQLLEGEAPRGLGQAVLEMIEARGYRVDTVPDAGHLQGANGRTIFDSKRVLIRSDMDDAAMVKTLIHEAAHTLLPENPPGVYLPRSRKEVEAESVAFVVAAAHGMRTSEYSFPYVSAWSSQSKDPAREIAATQARVAQAAKAILTTSPAEHSCGGRVPGVDAAVEAYRQPRQGPEQDPGQAAQAVSVGVA
jgi:antirestriction protein ArdC